MMACEQDDKTSPSFLQADEPETPATKLETSSDKRVPYLPPCRVCDSVASGFHYGVNTCEACKGFFRRCLARKSPLALCVKDGQCPMGGMDNRNSCPACRYEKCLSAGMSKSAIKTGRYTHQKRTKDTLEIKSRGCPAPSTAASCPTPEPSTEPSPSPSHAAPTARKSSTSADQPIDYSMGINRQSSQASSTDCDTLTDAGILELVTCAFRTNFADTTCMFEQTEFIDKLVKDMMAAHNMDQLDHVITCHGHSATDEEIRCIKTITEQTEVLKAIEKLDSSVSGDMMWTLPDCRTATRQLLECWSTNIDRFIRNIVQFAKKIPGFAKLPVNDQINLIKFGRPELAALIKFKHFNVKYDSCLDYHSESGVMTIFPNRILRGMFFSAEQDNSDRMWLFSRSMKQLMALDVHIQDLAIMCAIVLLSPDREQLSVEGRAEVAQLQAKLIPVLSHSLDTYHSQDKMALPKFLMILPMLRQVNELNNEAYITAQEIHKPEFSPLLQEVLPTPSSNNSGSKAGESTAFERRTKREAICGELGSVVSSECPVLVRSTFLS